MTALAVLVPTTPSAGPGLKPNDCSLAWTSFTSSRRSGVGFGSGATDAGCSGLAEPTFTTEEGWAGGTFAGGDGGDASVDSNRSGIDVALATSDSAGAVGAAAPNGDPTVARRLAMTDPTTAPRAKPITSLSRRPRVRSYACRAARRAAFAAAGSIARCRAACSASWRDRSAID